MEGWKERRKEGKKKRVARWAERRERERRRERKRKGERERKLEIIPDHTRSTLASVYRHAASYSNDSVYRSTKIGERQWQTEEHPWRCYPSAAPTPLVVLVALVLAHAAAALFYLSRWKQNGRGDYYLPTGK